jgi:hypothetical protein
MGEGGGIMIPLWYLIFVVPASVCFGVVIAALVVASRERRRTVVLRRLHEDAWNRDVDGIMREIHATMREAGNA